MEPSQAQHESPAKAADSGAPPGSLARFRNLASRLFGVDPKAFAEARTKDEAERRAKRGR
jgi:hypothetical protein